MLNFDVGKKLYKLPKLGEGAGGGGGQEGGEAGAGREGEEQEIIQAMPEKMHSFPQETVPNNDN